MEQMEISWEKIHSGDEDARQKMILDNMGLVRAVVRRYERRNVEQEDLIQIGSIGLMKAIDRFNPVYEVCFSTYAVPLISGEIKRFFRDDGIVKVARSIKENSWKLGKTREQLVWKLGREPTLAELSEQSGLTLEETVLAAGAGREMMSLNEPVYQKDGNEILLADQIDSGIREEEKFLDRYLIEEMIGRLTEPEQQIIRMRYFEECTQTQIAESLGMTQVKVSRMEKKILLRMREYFLNK